MARARMDWHMDVPTFTLSLLTVDTGISAMEHNAAGMSMDKQARALAETAIIASVAAYLSRSWWPLVIPFGYLAYDYAWSIKRGHAPEIGASEDGRLYDDGD